jgi:hypothetical protein
MERCGLRLEVAGPAGRSQRLWLGVRNALGLQRITGGRAREPKPESISDCIDG